VSFVGAGPGAADLITLRGARRIAEADVIVWAASLIMEECVTDHARADAELVDSSLIAHEDVLALYERAANALEADPVTNLTLATKGLVAGRELTIPEVAQSLILCRLEGGKTPMPEREKVREFARHGTTMAIFLSAARTSALVDELRAGGYPDDTPVVVAYRVSWPDELYFRCQLDEVAARCKEQKLWRHTLFLVGAALGAAGTRSHLYHAGHFHTFRKPDPAARRALRAARSAAQG